VPRSRKADVNARDNSGTYFDTYVHWYFKHAQLRVGKRLEGYEYIPAQMRCDKDDGERRAPCRRVLEIDDILARIECMAKSGTTWRSI